VYTDAEVRSLLEVGAIAAKYMCNKHGQRRPLSDYLSMANEIIAEALTRYNPEKGASLQTYTISILRMRLREVVGRPGRQSEIMDYPRLYDKQEEYIEKRPYDGGIRALEDKLDVENCASTLSERSYAMCRLLLQGYTNAEAARDLQLTPGRISQLKKQAIADMHRRGRTKSRLTTGALPMHECTMIRST
jgi:RNA polymerase sigma factor (sigma-70 family)